MIQALEVSAWAIAATGTSLVLAEVPWFRRTRLIDRLAPYSRRRPSSIGAGPADSIRQVIAPGIDRWGDRLSAALGVRHDLATRLDRAGLDDRSFRVPDAPGDPWPDRTPRSVLPPWWHSDPPDCSRQPPCSPCRCWSCSARSTGSAERSNVAVTGSRAELPVVAEQLGLLLSAGHSTPERDRSARCAQRWGDRGGPPPGRSPRPPGTERARMRSESGPSCPESTRSTASSRCSASTTTPATSAR